MISTRVFFTIMMCVVFLLLTGCSGSGVTPPITEPPAQPEVITGEKEVNSQHNLWGFWTIQFDPVALKLEVQPLRNSVFHIGITDMILPPACDDCLEVIFNSFDSETSILTFCIILRNQFPVTGHDVRGIIFTDDAGHQLTNADDWTGLHDIPGGHGINPFKGFYGLYGESEFNPGDARFETFEVYIPDPPHFTEFKFAVDASYPGQCIEPYAITDFTHEPFYDVTGHTTIAEVAVSDWQDDVDKVSLVAPEITGQSFTQFYPYDDIWRVDLTNNTGAPAGEYEARIIATSSGSGTQTLHDYVTIEINEATTPVVLNIEPDYLDAGTSHIDVIILGGNFSGPDSNVVLTCDSGPDIVATDIEVTGNYQVNCDFDIPLDALVGQYNVEVTNSEGKTGIGEGLFDVLTPSPVVLGIEPVDAYSGDSLEGVTVTGLAFLGPDAQVKLKKDSAPDIEAFNVSVVGWETITCDLDIPWTYHTGAWDVEVINDDSKSDIGEGLFTLNCPAPVVHTVDPNNHSADGFQFLLTVHGEKIIDGPDLAVKLVEGGQADIVASNVTWVDVNTLTSDVIIPAGTAKAYWGVEVTNGCGATTLKADFFHIHNLVWNEPSIALDSGYNTKVRDASAPSVSSYQSSTNFVIQGELCTSAVGTPAYEYYMSTSDTEQIGDTWHEFTFTGDDIISIDWTGYTSIAPSEVWPWVRCVDGPDTTEPHLFTTPMQLSHQIWGDAGGYDAKWTWWGLWPGAYWSVTENYIQCTNWDLPVMGDGGIRRNGTTFLSQGLNYTLESCDGHAWLYYTGCYMEPQIGSTGWLGTSVGPQFTYRAKWEYLSASFTVPSSTTWYVGFYVVDACITKNPLDFDFHLGNICLFHDP